MPEQSVTPDLVELRWRGVEAASRRDCGGEGVLRARRASSEPFEGMTSELPRIVGSGDLLVSSHCLRVTARYTRITFEEPSAYVWVFRDPDAALAVVGLEG